MSLHESMVWVISYETNKFLFFKLHSWLNGSPGSHLDIVKWLWIAPLISQFQMTRDNQVIKMSPFSTSDTLPFPPHLNNKSALECFLKQEKKKGKKNKRRETDFLFIFRLTLSLYSGVKMVSKLEGGKGPVKSASACVKVPGFLNSSLRTG